LIKFEIDQNKQGLEILLDANGVDELISYLHYIKANNEHIHLTAGNELAEEESLNGNEVITHVKIVYC
jgi:hypothetical protein